MQWFERVRELMDKKNVTQASLATDLDISTGALSHYLVGRRDAPIHLIPKLAKRFGCTTDYILLGAAADSTASQPLRLNAAMLAEAAHALAIVFERRGLQFDPVVHADALAAAYELRASFGESPKLADVIDMGERLASLVEQVGEEENGRIKGAPVSGVHRGAAGSGRG